MPGYTAEGADFYIGIGDDARWIGSVETDGQPWNVQGFDPLHGVWGEHTFQNRVALITGQHLDRGARACHADDAGCRPIEPGQRGRYAYALQPHNGVVHVFRDGRLIELRYPTGARKVTPFPVPAVAS